jgi:hypothetical protein
VQGTNIAALITPFTTEDKYATHDAKYGKGGYRSVLTIADRNNIPPSRREQYMTVGVAEDKMIYKLISNPETETTSDTDWKNIKDIDLIAANSDTISLWQSTHYKSIGLESSTVSLHTSSEYGKITWCLQINANIPTISFINNILWRFDNDLDFSISSFNIFEFETWDGGTTWLGRVNKYSISTPEKYIDSEYIDSILNWEHL